MSEEIDCWATDNIVCPCCAYEIKEDCWEYFPTDEHETSTHIECPECDKTFFCEREYSVTYSSSVMPCKNGEPHKFMFCHKWEDERIYYCRYCKLCERRKD